MNLPELATLVITGFVSCAEFGSYAFVHPVLRRLPQSERIAVEQGLLHTFGRAMPVGMILCVVLSVATAISSSRDLSWSAAAAYVLAVTFTVTVNVPINRATGQWDPLTPPGGWEQTVTAGSSSRQSGRGFSSLDSFWSAPQQPFEPR